MAWLATAIVLAAGYVREIAAVLHGIPSPKFGFQDFNLDQEGGLPAWFSSTLMLLCAVLMLLLRFDASRVGRRDAAGWTGLGVIFLLLSLDESASLHEQLTGPLRTMLSATGIFYFAWVVAGLAVVAFLSVIYLPFVLRLQRSVSRRLLLSAAIFVSGVIGMEMVGGWVVETYDHPPVYSLVMLIEETLELLGLTLLFSTMVSYVGERVSALHFTGHWPLPASRHRRAAGDQPAGRGS